MDHLAARQKSDLLRRKFLMISNGAEFITQDQASAYLCSKQPNITNYRFLEDLVKAMGFNEEDYDLDGLLFDADKDGT